VDLAGVVRMQRQYFHPLVLILQVVGIELPQGAAGRIGTAYQEGHVDDRCARQAAAGYAREAVRDIDNAGPDLVHLLGDMAKRGAGREDLHFDPTVGTLFQLLDPGFDEILLRRVRGGQEGAQLQLDRLGRRAGAAERNQDRQGRCGDGSLQHDVISPLVRWGALRLA